MVQLVTTADVSIIMPIRNGIEFAPKSLKKLLNIANGMEVVIIDDGSNDGSFEFCDSFCAKNSNFTIYKNPGSGISQALNYGIAQAKGTWIARFDIDDDYDSYRIMEQINIVNKTQCDLVFSDYSFYANGSHKMGSIASAIFSDPVKLSLISGRRTPHPSVFFRKELYERSGGYLIEDSPAEDLSLWLRMHNLGTFASSPNELLRYRLAGSSTTIQHRASSIRKRRELLLKYPIGIDIFNNAINNLKDTIEAYDNLKNGNERIILHLIDICLFSNVYKSKIPLEIKLVILRKIFSFSGLATCALLINNALRRYNFRKAQVLN